MAQVPPSPLPPKHVLRASSTSRRHRDQPIGYNTPRVVISSHPFNEPNPTFDDRSRDPVGVTIKAYSKVTVALSGKRRAQSDSGDRPQIIPRDHSLPRFKSLFARSSRDTSSHRISLSMDHAVIVPEDHDHQPTGAQDILPLPEGSEAEHYELIDEIKVPALLQQGTPMLKMSAKQGPKLRKFWLDADQGQLLWESKKRGLISIENIREMRTGANARNYRESFKVAVDAEPRWLTIIYVCDGKYKTLHVVALSVDVFRMWNQTLQKLYCLRRELMCGLGNMERRQLVWEKQYWKGGDASGDSKLDFGEVEKMCKRLNIHSARADLLAKFQKVDSNHDGYLDFNDFRRFVTLLKARPDIEILYTRYSKNGRMEYGDFSNLMRQVQKTTLDDQNLRQVFNKYCVPVGSAPSSGSGTQAHQPGVTSHQTTPSQPGAHVGEAPAMTLASFTTFLMSADNAPFSGQASQINQDMTRPMSEYYVSSSHNTYLVGNQLVGQSTCEGYIRVLLQGCRSVELDIWDGDFEPCVYHGRTLTSRVSVREISRAIMKYAFVASPYPIIISAEIHCRVEQQDLLARIFREEFGDALVTGPLPGREYESESGVQILPSPEDLRGKILVKAKKLCVSQNSPLEDKDVSINAESSETSETSEEQETSGLRGFMEKVREGPSALLRGKSPSRTGTGSSAQSSKSKTKVSEGMAAILFYTIGVKCRGLNKKETYEPVHMFSLSEKTASKIMKATMLDLIKHNRTHLVRIYPKGTRMSSTNYEPHRYWASGAQLVAINWQTCDLGYMINHAMFQRNGACGLVLKPEALRVKDKQSLGTLTKHYLDVKIISAQQLPHPKDSEGRELNTKSIIDPFVEVTLHVPDWSTENPETQPARESSTGLHLPILSRSPSKRHGTHHIGVASSARMVSMRTHVVNDNGFNPMWEHDMAIPFDLMGDKSMMDTIFVRFEVRDRGEREDNPIGVYCISLGSLMMGYRHLPLHDQQMSQYLFSTLFVKIGIRDV
ncbi:Phospholipase C [Tulasnella sp. JGI-2019a]|nr:Phospholipase C [Tulasnella sp. JGI-2019a]